MLISKKRLKEIVLDEMSRYSRDPSTSPVDEAIRDLHMASGLLESAASVLHKAGDSKMGSIIHNVMAINETLYTQVQILRNVDYGVETDSPYSPSPTGVPHGRNVHNT